MLSLSLCLSFPSHPSFPTSGPRGASHPPVDKEKRKSSRARKRAQRQQTRASGATPTPENEMGETSVGRKEEEEEVKEKGKESGHTHQKSAGGELASQRQGRTQREKVSSPRTLEEVDDVVEEGSKAGSLVGRPETWRDRTRRGQHKKHGKTETSDAIPEESVSPEPVKEEEREPIEDDHDWGHQHTCSEEDLEALRRRKLKSASSTDQQPLPEEQEGEEVAVEKEETQDQMEKREEALFQERRRERDQLKAERMATRMAEEKKMSLTRPPSDPFTKFETLQVPTLEWDIPTSQLFSYFEECTLSQVGMATKLQLLQNYFHFYSSPPSSSLLAPSPLSLQVVPQQYKYYSGAWRSVEPLPPLHPLIRPKPPSDTFNTTLDEVWCPMLAGVTETQDILPPRIHYVGNMVTKYIAHYPPHYRTYDF